MLNFLSIQNIVLIDKAEIKFSSGLCILTGETGSGKSILLDALGLAIGFRSSFRLIGNEENKAFVSAEFDISKNQICQKLLQENDLLDSENPGCLRIRRVIHENSASKVFLNDQAIGVTLLAKIGESLVEIHGQHDQRGLLNQHIHCEILDEFALNINLLSELRKNYDQLKEVDNKISDLKNKKEQAEREKDYLEHVVNELEDADIKEGEEGGLATKKTQLSAKERISNFLTELKSNLVESNSNLILSQKILIRNQHLIDNFLNEQKEDFDHFSEKIDGMNSALDAEISCITSLFKVLNSSEDSLEEIEERLFYIRSLARKFNVTIAELPKIIFDAKEKLGLISNEEKLNSDLENQRLVIFNNYKRIAKEVGDRRKESAKILATKVKEELKFLKMENTKFLVEVTDYKDDSTYSPNGYNRVRFLASINKNDFDDISKIASGGELSRFMLALKVSLMNTKSIPTIIFDEIDTGIGGSTSDAVGKRLKILSQNLQVLVVTHQPQIAAKGNSHLKISKTTNAEKIRTVVERLDEASRQKEIARMLSGEAISSEALAAATKLIQES